jgi:hypothetical protein
LRETAIDEEFSSCHITAVIRGQKHHCLGDLIGPTEPAKWNAAMNHFDSFLALSAEASRLFNPGVSIVPGLIALIRMRRSFKSVVHVRANERIAAFVAL